MSRALACKRQTIQYPRNTDNLVCPPGRYDAVQRPLPSPPEGHVWNFNHATKEWKVVSKEEALAAEETGSRLTNMNEEASWDSCDFSENLNDVTADTSGAKKADARLLDEPPSKGLDSSNSISTKKQPPFHQHVVQPSDTFQGLCLRYHVTATELRRANRFSGSNLLLAPSVLTIPVDPATVKDRPAANDAPLIVPKERYVNAVLYAVNHQCASNNHGPKWPKISALEARTYLDLNDWNVEDAVKEAKGDLAFEAESSSKTTLSSDLDQLALGEHYHPMTTSGSAACGDLAQPLLKGRQRS